jgi:hypothetical protein
VLERRSAWHASRFSRIQEHKWELLKVFRGTGLRDVVQNRPTTGYTAIPDRIAGKIIPSWPTKILHVKSYPRVHNLLLVLLIGTIIATLLGSLGLLPPDTTRATATERRSQREVDVLLRIETNDEGGNVDDLLADTAKMVRQGNPILYSGIVLTGCASGG